MSGGSLLTAVAAAALAAGAVASIAGGALLLRAGAVEKRGLLEAARRIARRGGMAMGGGALLELGAGVVLSLSIGRGPAVWPLAATALVAAAGAGFAGLLAGLAGKPRPTGALAVILLLVAAVLAALCWR